MVGAYFSKPDWHSEYYWWPRYATPRRTQNYNIDKNPWRWNQFKEFTYNQIGELMHNYGPIDILWLDGGWVNNPGTKSVLDMDRISQMARQAQPGILFVDRTIHGKYENYQTPEQQIPDKQLPTRGNLYDTGSRLGIYSACSIQITSYSNSKTNGNRSKRRKFITWCRSYPRRDITG